MRTWYETAASIDATGRLQIEELDAFRAAVAEFGIGSRLVVRVEEYKAKRSTRANNYYFGVVLHTIAEQTDRDVEDLHAFFKRQFLATAMTLGKMHTVIGGSTRKLNSAEFAEYLDRVRHTPPRSCTSRRRSRSERKWRDDATD